MRYQPFRSRDKDHDERDQDVQRDHEPPDQLIAVAYELGQHEPARCINGGVANDHDWQAAVGAVVEPSTEYSTRSCRAAQLCGAVPGSPVMWCSPRCSGLRIESFAASSHVLEMLIAPVVPWHPDSFW
jgi:hypothetical protein